MKYQNLIKQKHCHPGTFSLADLSTKSNKHFLDVNPFNTAADRSAKNEFQRRVMFLLHVYNSTK